MNANLVSILSWSRPEKTVGVLITVNLLLWVLTRQSPFYVFPMATLIWYCRHLWRSRIRGEILLDPPDHEDWTALTAYDFQQATTTLISDMYAKWVSLRESNHLMWTIATCTVWVMLAKIGMEMDFLTMLFILSNAAFVVFPALEYLPKIDVSHEPERASATTSGRPGSRHSTPAQTPSTVQSFHSATPTPSSSSSLIHEFYEGIVTRSKAAANLVTSTPTGAAMFSIGEQVTSMLQARERSQSPESDPHSSLSPSVPQMPGHEEVTAEADSSDPEEEFLFDARHFDKSSSSRSSTSVSNSFEIIDEDMQ